LAGGMVYMPNDDCVITVIKPGPTFNVVSKNAIGEQMNASPAVSNGKIYLRGEKHLFICSTNNLQVWQHSLDSCCQTAPIKNSFYSKLKEFSEKQIQHLPFHSIELILQA